MKRRLNFTTILAMLLAIAWFGSATQSAKGSPRSTDWSELIDRVNRAVLECCVKQALRPKTKGRELALAVILGRASTKQGNAKALLGADRETAYKALQRVAQFMSDGKCSEHEPEPAEKRSEEALAKAMKSDMRVVRREASVQVSSGELHAGKSPLGQGEVRKGRLTLQVDPAEQKRILEDLDAPLVKAKADAQAMSELLEIGHAPKRPPDLEVSRKTVRVEAVKRAKVIP